MHPIAFLSSDPYYGTKISSLHISKDTGTIYFKIYNVKKEMVKSFEEISKMLKEALLINAARAKTLTLIIFAMINCETVNLSKLSKHFKTHVKQASSYKRLQRFIKEVSFEATKLARVLLAFADVGANEKLKLILDRTNWKFGKNYVNILCLSVVTPNGNFPLFLEHARR